MNNRPGRLPSERRARSKRRRGLFKVIRNRNHLEGALAGAQRSVATWPASARGSLYRPPAAPRAKQDAAWVGLEAGTETLQVSKAELLRYNQHLGFVALHLVQADLMNLLRVKTWWCGGG